MARFATPPFGPGEDGAIVVALDEREVELLAHLAGEMGELLEEADPDDPVLERLFPRAYLDPTEERAEQEWQSLVRPQLLRDRLDALTEVTGTLAGGRRRRGRVELAIDVDEAQAWLGALNDARLALGTRLGVSEETEYAGISPEHPQAHAYALYGWLTYLQSELIDLLLG